MSDTPNAVSAQTVVEAEWIETADQDRWNALSKALQQSKCEVARELDPLFYFHCEEAWSASKAPNLFGLAFSGGGIRSATFNLGIAQFLATAGLLNAAHYLSTVSGGGYLGGCIHALNHQAATGKGDDAQSQLKQEHFKADSIAVKHLRAYSRYLAPGGLLDNIRMAAQPAMGLAVNLLILFGALTSIAALGGLSASILARFKQFWPLETGWSVIDIWPQYALGTMAAVILVVATGSMFLYRQLIKLAERTRNGRWFSLFILLACVLILIDQQNHFSAWLRDTANAELIYWMIVPATALLLSLRFRGKEFAALRLKIMLTAAGAIAPAAVLRAYLCMAPQMTSDKLWPAFMRGPLASHDLYLTVGIMSAAAVALTLFTFLFSRKRWFPWPALLAATPLCVSLARIFLSYDSEFLNFGSYLIFSTYVAFISMLVNVNTTGPHRFYRDRLSSAYAFAINGETTTDQDELRLSELWKDKSKPYPLINATMNASRSGEEKHKALAVREPDFFLFSPKYVGCRLTGYRSTEIMEKRDPYLNLPTAIAISGAAASSNMGRHNMPEVRFLMTLLNIRLGYWLPNPGKTGAWVARQDAASLLGKEMIGGLSSKSDYVNVSDGGHIENLGAYELIRRQCRLIVIGEAEDDTDPADPTRSTMAALANLARMVRIDFGYFIDFHKDDLERLKGGQDKRCWAVGTIYYSQDRIGKIVYLKPVLTGDEDMVIADYARANPSFPRQSTGDQFFSEDQFEAYRALGHHVAKAALGGIRL